MQKEKESSESGGTTPMVLQSRLSCTRERLYVNMTEEERQWRAQWIKDQHLAPGEPRFAPELHRARYNIIRRIYRYPLDRVGAALLPFLGTEKAFIVRSLFGRTLLAIGAVYMTAYYFKYHEKTWEATSGFQWMESKRRILPGEPEYRKDPDPCAKKPIYGDLYFHKANI